MRLGILHTHAHHGVALLAEGAVVVAKGTGLGRAAAGGILRIEIEHQFLTLEIGQPYLLAILVEAQYFGRFFSCFQHNRYIYTLQSYNIIMNSE